MNVKAFVVKPTNFVEDYGGIVGEFIAHRDDILEVVHKVLKCSDGGDMLSVMIYYKGDKCHLK